MTPFENPPSSSFERDLICPVCKNRIRAKKISSQKEVRYCPYCGSALSIPRSEETIPREEKEEVSFIQKHLPEPTQINFSLGSYQIIKSLGKGGMGEVFLAYDTICGRQIALKKVRSDLQKHKHLYRRFLKEARITGQLTHPGIIPIYSIHRDKNLIYYTMPYVEGETLKEIIRETRRKEKRRESPHHLGSSIPTLIRILITISQAVSYAHSHGVLHRDLKPENIIVGKYGEVLILDWGLAKLIKKQDEKFLPEIVKEIESLQELTRMGKVVGTVTYMSPERAEGAPASIKTDIYSLGVILYQMLTLHSPFKRTSLEEFRKNLKDEVFIDPIEMAPYRDISPMLSQICQKCLEKDPEMRYESVNALIGDLENFLEGRSDWFQTALLDIHCKDDWEFQEHVLIADHMAITRNTEVADWVSMMVSQSSFNENIKIEASLQIKAGGQGVGFLLSLPEKEERKQLNDGYCLWLSSQEEKSTKLLRSGAVVIQAPDAFLNWDTWVHVRIEKIRNNIHFYLDNELQLSYISHIPLTGTHIGIISRDDRFEILDFAIFEGGESLTQSCLAVPDAFFAHKDYSKALTEYRRIATTFSGRSEGREALFKAGLTLLEEAKATRETKVESQLYGLALSEFEKLHKTPGAPLEYLGKALVYQTLGDLEEEVKCYELSLRRYPSHPLLYILQEQIIYRLHESAQKNRKATYYLTLIIIRHLPALLEQVNFKKIRQTLKKNWEKLEFIEEEGESTLVIQNLSFAVKLAFWLKKPYFLEEMILEMIEKHPLNKVTLHNALFALIELGSGKLAQNIIETKLKKEDIPDLNLGTRVEEEPLSDVIEEYFKLDISSFRKRRLGIYLVETAKRKKHYFEAKEILSYLQKENPPHSFSFIIDYHRLWLALLEEEWEILEKIFESYPKEDLTHEKNPLHFLYGCFLLATKKRDLFSEASILDAPYPRTWTLATYFLTGKIDLDRWEAQAFFWEKRKLYQELSLYYHVTKDPEKESFYGTLED